MKFGVVLCPRCMRFFGIELAWKSASCKRCGARVDLSKAKVFFKTDSREDLSDAIGSLNADRDGRFDDFKQAFGKV